MLEIKEKIVGSLREVYDPELPINIYDLGLIYSIDVNDNADVNILMTLTSPTCPTADYIKSMVEEATQKVEGVGSVLVEITFDPPWTPARVSKEAKEELGLVEEDVSMQNTFVSDSQVLNPQNQPLGDRICFNCGATEGSRPVLKCFYKDEQTYICSKCLSKF